jgi:hypothetical protein
VEAVGDAFIKLRSRLFLHAEASDDDLCEAALADEKVRAATSGREVVKTLVIK